MSTVQSADETDFLNTEEVQQTILHAKHEEKKYFDLESIGSEAMYRCPKCRVCCDCKKGESLEMTSLKEEMEQRLIEQSVTFDFNRKILLATLPFVYDPIEELQSNYTVAEKILQGQLKKVNKSPEIKSQVIASHEKLVSNGYSVKYDDLSDKDKNAMNELNGEYYLPWRFVHKEGSLSTPVRCVFDASSKTSTGKSLNDCLAKGINKLEKIFSLLVNFRAGEHAFTCDIRMAYNQLKLSLPCSRWHKYLWVNELDPKNPSHIRIMTTIIYGVVSSGNQTNEGIMRIAEYCKANYPQYSLGASVLAEKTYVDDAADAADTREELMEKIDGVDYTLALGNMFVKSYVTSGEEPHESVSSDKENVSILGYKWNPKLDTISLEEKQLFFGKSQRGKRPEAISGDVKSALMKNFTRRNILSKVAGNFDPLGLYTPITAIFKLDYSDLSGRNIGWDDGLPLECLDKWVRNLELMVKIQNISFPRSVFSGINNVTIITSVDASQNLGIACVHVRSEKADGTVSVRLAAAKSKIVQGSTIPRAEMKAAVVGCTLADVVKKNLKGKVTKSIYVTDSSIVLSWLNQDARPMSIAIRNSVIEVRRFSNRSDWFHIDTKNNIADLGTRGKVGVEQINETSDWQRGKAWMYLPEEEMPLKTIKDLQITDADTAEIKKECKPSEFHGHITMHDGAVESRYLFSNYIIDPCYRSWPKVINILCYVRRFCYFFLKRLPRSETLPGVNQINDSITEGERKIAEDYFFAKGTKEVKQFVAKKDYADCTTEKNGILYYKSRILDNADMKDMANIITDLKPLHFVVPVLDRFSPISYSLMDFSHHKLACHRNINVTMTESRHLAFIFNGRDLAKEVCKSCTTCRKYQARVLEVEMAKVHENRLTVAPPFFHTQIDLMGPFLAYCEHNHRSSVKVWGAVFRDPTCGAISVHTMSNYSADAFVTAFTRFAHIRGFPAKIFIDPGSQLKSACEGIEISIADITNTINGKYGTGIIHEVSPTAAHNYQGCVERSIKEVKKIFKMTFDGLKMDVLHYETAFSYVANEINNLPICMKSRVSDLGNVDLITPSRLLHGRNNRRAPVGEISLSKPGRLLKQMDQLYESWWLAWANEKLADFVPQRSDLKRTTYQPKEGDVCVFMMDRGEAINHESWKIGKIIEVHFSKDDIARAVTIEYFNCAKEGKQYVSRRQVTKRSLRRVAVLFAEDEISLTEQLNLAARVVAGHHTFLSRNGQQSAKLTK